MEAGTTMIKRCGKAAPGVGGLTGRLLGNRGGLVKVNLKSFYGR